MSIVGRVREQAVFDQIISSDSAEFIALYGRRRVSKTYLIQQYFQDKGRYFELVGRHKAARKIQLHNFSKGCAKVFNANPESEPETWDAAFEQLQDCIEKRDSSEKIILFFDELPWLASRKSGFLEALGYFWNHYASKNSNVILIVCGSAASWMIKKIIANRGGLHNRLTRPAIRLLPFTLKETEEYLKARYITLDRKQLIHLYMALGGVAYYLNFISQEKSSAEIIQELFFSPNAPLQMEFQQLFASLFQNYKKHIAIIKTLAASHQGLTLDEIIKK